LLYYLILFMQITEEQVSNYSTLNFLNLWWNLTSIYIWIWNQICLLFFSPHTHFIFSFLISCFISACKHVFRPYWLQNYDANLKNANSFW
jgi:hypothetical protein